MGFMSLVVAVYRSSSGVTKQHTVGNPPFGMDKTDKPSQLQVLCPDMHSHRARDQHG